ncbi:MAG: NAD(P)-dependent oxidoreductase [Bacteroidaceae bacterium]|jgi:nucleoside-diphosphate-sugar epimerase|nr:NAD(P)-dependent oxidoreductase [Bacteroidaceae bacterium]MBR1492456.1 NAD(P)-dependent oxidoreductase [Bacteroidaceae bacterium]
MATYIITGATGLIGGALVESLLAKSGNKLILPVRNVQKAERRFGQNRQIVYIGHDFLSGSQLDIQGNVDYIVHAACPTASKYMAESPVETIDTIVNGTRTMLQVARKSQVKGMVFLSSMEVYGTVQDDSPIDESVQGYVPLLNARSSYPVAKRLAETLCHSYTKEYSVPVCIARLTQTFGPGVDISHDMRVFAQFARCARDRQDIVLNTEGRTKRMYLHTADAVDAILLLLTKGVMGEAYNVANRDTYCSIREMAEFVKETFSPSISVVVRKNDRNFYLPEMMLPLSTEKIEHLGWTPKYGLRDMFEAVIKS